MLNVQRKNRSDADKMPADVFFCIQIYASMSDDKS